MQLNRSKELHPSCKIDMNQYFIPLSHLDGVFSYDGCINNKGATKIFQEHFDDELILWLQHRAN